MWHQLGQLDWRNPAGESTSKMAYSHAWQFGTVFSTGYLAGAGGLGSFPCGPLRGFLTAWHLGLKCSKRHEVDIFCFSIHWPRNWQTHFFHILSFKKSLDLRFKKRRHTPYFLMGGLSKNLRGPVWKHQYVVIGLDITCRHDQVRKKREVSSCALLFIEEGHLFLQRNSTQVLLPRHGSHIHAKPILSHRNKKWNCRCLWGIDALDSTEQLAGTQNG